MVLYLLVGLVAFLYSSVGHGGASGYLAVLSLFGYAPAQMKTSALLLNLLVAGAAFASFRRAGHFQGRLLWPFAAGSVPMAFVGGWIKVSPRLYAGLLAASLVVAALRLAMPDLAGREPGRPPGRWTALAVGAAIGLISGLIGVGGGIFLSPLLILLGWADAKATAAASAAFIWINSAAGLAGSLGREGPGALGLWGLAASALAGGLAGSSVGARLLPSLALRRLLSAVLLIAAYKLAVI